MKKVQEERVQKKGRVAGSFALGNEADKKIIDSAGDSSQFFKMENEKGPNIFGLVHAEFFTLVEHWYDADGKREKVVCGAHGTNDPVKILNGFVPDDCPICQRTLQLYQEAKQNPDDALNKRKKEIANELRGSVSFLFPAIKGEADVSRVGGKRMIKPFFENTTSVGLLSLSRSTFTMLSEEFDKSGFKSVDAIGMPVNFEKGKKNEKQRYAQVLSVEFFPKFKVKVPTIDTEKLYAPYGVYDKAKAEEALAKFDKEFAAAMAGLKGGKKAVAGKKAK